MVMKQSIIFHTSWISQIYLFNLFTCYKYWEFNASINLKLSPHEKQLCSYRTIAVIRTAAISENLNDRYSSRIRDEWYMFEKFEWRQRRAILVRCMGQSPGSIMSAELPVYDGEALKGQPSASFRQRPQFKNRYLSFYQYYFNVWCSAAQLLSSESFRKLNEHYLVFNINLRY